MPNGAVPDRYRDILASTTFGLRGPIDPNEQPRVNAVWFLQDGAHVPLSIQPDASKN